MDAEGPEVGRADGGSERSLTGDVEATFTAHVQRLAELPTLWAGLMAGERRVRGRRHLEVLAVRLTELLETTNGAGALHPASRPLAPFLDACPEIVGEWRLDAVDLLLHLERAQLQLPPLFWAWEVDDADDDPAVAGDRVVGPGIEAMAAFVGLAQPPRFEGGHDEVFVGTLRSEGARSIQHLQAADLPVLAAAAHDHLVDRLPTSVLLARTSDLRAEPERPSIGPVHDVDAARAADRLADLLAGLEDALARCAAARRGPDGGTEVEVEVEVEHRRAVLFDRAGRIEVGLRQILPAGTVEAVTLDVELLSGDDPDGLDVLPVVYDLRLDLRGADRGAGVLRVQKGAGRAERAVLLPAVTELWSDHIESALRRARVIVPAFPRRALDEARDPVPVVEPPLVEVRARHSSCAMPLAYIDIPF